MTTIIYPLGYLPLNKFRFLRDTLNSTLMNTEISNIYSIMTEFVKAGPTIGKKFKFVSANDKLYIEHLQILNLSLVDSSGNLNIKGTLNENVTF